jgi:hypothetical protein
MKKRLALTFCLFSGCLLLAGCTDADWDHVMNYGGLNDADEMPAPRAVVRETAPPPATVAAEPANTDFCRGVAEQDARNNDFDQATKTRVYARSYGQCLAIYTR